jgi:glycosyltransferase involved in cell wall biosynthesis
VCIPAYNDAQAFSRCLDSALRQRDVTLECIVSDDSATGNIERCAAGRADRRVVYRRNDVPSGPTANWNRALRFAQGTYITLLHQDDWYRSESALREIYAILQNTQADLLFCGRALYRAEKCLGEYSLTLKTVADFRKGFPGRTLVVNTLGTPSTVFCHRKHSGILYDTALVYFADTDCFARLLAAADKTAVCGKPHIGIGVSDAQLSAACLARPDTLIRELAYGLRKHKATCRERGLALARFFAGNLRHWRKKTLLAALENVKEHFSPAVAGILLLSLPIFLTHMLYRVAYRQIAGKAWV